MLLEVPACTTGSQPMRRQDGGDVGGGISSKVQELRMDASSKGIAWLQKKVESMNQTEQRKMAAAVALSTRGPGGAMVPLAELRNALVEHISPEASLGGKVFGLVRISFLSCERFLWVASQNLGNLVTKKTGNWPKLQKFLPLVK